MESSSATSGMGGDALDLRYISKKCLCGKRAAIRVTESDKPSKGKLYYACESAPRGCDFWAWCKPVKISHVKEEYLEERSRVLPQQWPRVVPEDPHLVGRLVMVEASVAGMKKWVFITSVLCILCMLMLLANK
ncbi:hypothetical protein Vadar_011475 [Vaccinium darrowii]|uniref:Uncharacterized protein n=2 Tax=Vaccinium darrowii TaxID=229202 RepID=A0ACB7X3J0_9ERIC|nr:hypothetical protein Vadar_024400 [Vaccinium darrowii]KAH7854221.1 hypothetical protein Vadar_011475 [Vaccinium darrowii]